MGANWMEMTARSPVNDREGLQLEFRQEQERDRYENGHSYSGGLGMATGLLIDDCPPLPDLEQARRYLQERTRKWEEARAARFEDHRDGLVRWLIGGWCAS